MVREAKLKTYRGPPAWRGGEDDEPRATIRLAYFLCLPFRLSSQGCSTPSTPRFGVIARTVFFLLFVLYLSFGNRRFQLCLGLHEYLIVNATFGLL